MSRQEKPQFLESYMRKLWHDKNKDKTIEYEVRFGTIGKRRITKTNYDNVLKYLKFLGFTLDVESTELKITSSYTNREGIEKPSNIRTIIHGSSNISEYCKTDSITNERSKLKKNITFLQKKIYMEKGDDGKFTTVRPGNYNDFAFRVTLNEEIQLYKNNNMVNTMITDWDNKKKTFRLVNRIRLNHTSHTGIYVYLSIVKSSQIKLKKQDDRVVSKLIPTNKTIEGDFNLFEQVPTYEIEIEYDNRLDRRYTDYTDENSIEDSIKNSIKKVKQTITNILRGLQETNFPVSYDILDDVLQNYLENIYKDGYKEQLRENEKVLRVYPSQFIGPSSITLEQKNMVEIKEGLTIPNIRKGYTVTDKADGLRKLLFVNSDGNIYLINTNMRAEYTGLKTTESDLYCSILDGEHILYNKNNEYINKYAIFDIYFDGKKDVRTLPLISNDSNDRYTLMKSFKNKLYTDNGSKLETKRGGKALIVTTKQFKYSSTENGIFKYCKEILDQSNSLEYKTDGLIFTPASNGVAMSNGEKEPINKKITWIESFKWKPPEQNTIDFLVTTKKDTMNKDLIETKFNKGVDLSSMTQTENYKTLILRVGYDIKKHGYINPCEDVINDNITKLSDGNRNEYKPVPFYPTNPVDINASIHHIKLNDDNDMVTTEDNEVFYDNTIVEFSYSIEDGWSPLRVRHDKTDEYRMGLKNYGNAYHVANSVWQSIHSPITKEMITTGNNVPDIITDDNIYYNPSGRTVTRELRDFHNRYVKRKLITGVSKKSNILIDLAVGKGGDLSKWRLAKLKFVFGIDISKDNIENKLDGACARYLSHSRDYDDTPKALFVEGNTGKIISNGNAFINDKGKQISKALFGLGSKDEKVLGKGVYDKYGVADHGFDVVSCQFAIHYMFESSEILNNFLNNVRYSCKKNGYFIGTCYDGVKIFNRLKDKKQHEKDALYVDGKKMWEVTKIYDTDTFEANEKSIGKRIDVYQESINKTFPEYLVNFEYLKKLMKIFGFDLISDEEAKKMGLPSGSGLFKKLFNEMKKEVKNNRKLKDDVRSAIHLGDEKNKEQKEVSFLNRYFVFKKTVDGRQEINLDITRTKTKTEKINVRT